MGGIIKKIIVIGLILIILAINNFLFNSVQEINKLNEAGFVSETKSDMMAIITTPIYRSSSDGTYHDYISTHSPFSTTDFVYSSNYTYDDQNYFLSIEKDKYSSDLHYSTDIYDEATQTGYMCPITTDLKIDIDRPDYYLMCSSLEQQLQEDEDILTKMYNQGMSELDSVGFYNLGNND